jgi:hypothetical protein
LVTANGDYAFTLSAGNLVDPSWQPYDHVVITGVLWDDDTVEGEARLLSDEPMIRRGRTVQLGRVLDALRGGGSAKDVSERIATLPVSVTNLRPLAGIGMEQVKSAAVGDLRAAVANRSFNLAALITAYEAWQKRASALDGPSHQR